MKWLERDCWVAVTAGGWPPALALRSEEVASNFHIGHQFRNQSKERSCNQLHLISRPSLQQRVGKRHAMVVKEGLVVIPASLNRPHRLDWILCLPAPPGRGVLIKRSLSEPGAHVSLEPMSRSLSLHPCPVEGFELGTWQ